LWVQKWVWVSIVRTTVDKKLSVATLDRAPMQCACFNDAETLVTLSNLGKVAKVATVSAENVTTAASGAVATKQRAVYK